MEPTSPRGAVRLALPARRLTKTQEKETIIINHPDRSNGYDNLRCRYVRPTIENFYDITQTLSQTP